MTASDELPQQEIARWLECRSRTLKEEYNSEVLVERLKAFIGENSVPSTSSNYKRQEEDDLQPLLQLVGSVVSEHQLMSSALTCLKILSRKEQNRKAIGFKGFKHLTAAVHFVKDIPSLAAECANVVLNFCYSKENVEHFLACNGVPLLAEYLHSEDIQVQANTDGALQSISFHEKGRKQLKETPDVLPKIVEFLNSQNSKVKARAVGALHNLSSEPGTIIVIRKERGIEQLVDLLRDENPVVAGSAAGALQNISREVASRNLIKDLDAVQYLADLLCSPHLQCQVCAAGALMNVLGPEISQHTHSKHRKAFSKLISQCLTLGVLYNAIWEPCSDRPEVV